MTPGETLPGAAAKLLCFAESSAAAELLQGGKGAPSPSNQQETRLFVHLVTELRSVVQSCRELSPLARGLAIGTTPTDSELVNFTVTVDELAGRVKKRAEQLLGLLVCPAADEELEDLFALVSMEIQGKMHRLDEVLLQPQVPVWEKASTAMGLGAKVIKGATAIENTLCSALGSAPELSLVGEIEDALAVRQAYCKMWMSLPLSEPPPEQLEGRLRSAATAIARLTGREVFLDMRFDDRRLLLSLQRRIRKWLASGGASESGLHLFQDLAGLFCLLAQINHRIELLMHDEALVAELGRRLTGCGEAMPLREETLRRRFELLLGRNIDLDRHLLERDYTASRETLRSLLEQIARRWRRPDNVEK